MTALTRHRARRALAPAPRRGVGAALRATAVVACLPYLSLKIAWFAGSHIGIPEGSELRQDGNSLMAINALTVLMDGVVILLAFLLTRPWGQRVPAWLLAVPIWCASGLLAPIIVAFPVQTVAAALHGHTVTDDGADALLDSWVWSVVYSGFIVQALTLAILFVRYARERWGHLWRGRIGALPPSPTRSARRLIAGVASTLALFAGAMHLVWATGGTFGLSPARAASQDFNARVNDASYVLFAVLTIAGILLLAHGRGRRLPVLVALTAAWTGAGALACWGGWMTLTTLPVPAGDPRLPAPLMSLTYSVQMITGIVVATAGAHFFAERETQHRAEHEAARCD
ncbi:hypothetical protein SSP35_31_00110 [Streptomyces sp. NBRC 110611]|uniref:hypothetical protein n=1 Tax=Streptomyces sp. NBRC 110611 TaxID=1621259 RepID=UPI0008588032|nr:hypothetical protein [Streptomyces sp. NBRC 110611]GAU71246.1 hypothetical protein SSP35_31_00110 [Streptomyces sp. NBRC 110611]